MKWYNEKVENNYVFNFQEEMEKYCRSDVDILRRSCMLFRKLFLKVAKCDPFQYLTIASVCMGIFRHHFVENNTLGMVPVNGYTSNTNHSVGAIEWLDYLQRSEGCFIQHALNSTGEYKIGKYSVDGYCSEKNTVYQYDGCFWHGHLACYDKDIDHPLKKVKMGFVYKQTLERDEFIKSQGYNLVTIWECDWQDQKKGSAIQHFLKDHLVTSRLEPRDAFFGGRTNATQLYRTVGEGERIKYIDFTSLYPWTNKYCSYPVGHPEIITYDFKDVSSYFGLIKCTILPPRKLYHPVLPYRTNGKLFFPLCRSCAVDMLQSTCHHSDDERALQGTWVSEEVKKAIEKGYTILRMHEVYHFKSSSTQLFEEYVNTFLKLKQEASGWPAHCLTQESKKEYINNYLEHEGITLDADKIEKNPGLRTLSKLCLNSFWGRFGMNENKTQTVFYRSTVDINRLLANPANEIKSFQFADKEGQVLQLSYEHKGNFQPQRDATNIFVAAFTTAHARLKLYDALDHLKESVLYYDTDSIIYVSNGSNDPPTGDYLGEFTDELDGKYITTFVSGGPKNYAYTCSDGSQTAKVKGFTLNFQNLQKINFESMVALVCNEAEAEQSIVVENNRFCRNSRLKTIENKLEEKKYRVCYTKRALQPDYNTLPYGY